MRSSRFTSAGLAFLERAALLAGTFAAATPSFADGSPQLWWVHPAAPTAKSTLRLFGRDLPATVELEPLDVRAPARRLRVVREGAYALTAPLPGDLAPGRYRVHAGAATSCGHETIEIVARPAAPRAIAADSPAQLQRELAVAAPGSVIRLGEGTYPLYQVLTIPRGVALEGAGSERTVLRLSADAKPVPGLVKSQGTLEQMAAADAPVAGRSGAAATLAVLMTASGGALRRLAIDGGGTADIGIAVAGTKAEPVAGISIEDVAVNHLAPMRGVHGQSAAVLIRHARGVRVLRSELRGQGPALFLEDVTGSEIGANRLAGGGEGVVSGREGGVRRTLIEDNQFLGRREGAVQAVRAVWLSTLFGSVYRNYIARNRGMDFHPPPGTGQNRGEAILMETALTHPYFGAPAASGASTLELPAQGVDWPRLAEDLGTRATHVADYFAVVVAGPGRGQTRRVVGRSGRTLELECDWSMAPGQASTVLVTELVYRNLIVGNSMHDAMTGVQLWMSSAENVIARNELSQLTREGVLIFADAKGGPQSVPPFWPIPSSHVAGFNRGLGVSFLNVVEDNEIRGAKTGVDLAVGDFRAKRGPIPWPLDFGNVVRGNTVSETVTEYRTGMRYQ